MEIKPEKPLRRSLFAVASLLDYKTALLLPTPMAVSQLYASIAQHREYPFGVEVRVKWDDMMPFGSSSISMG